VVLDLSPQRLQADWWFVPTIVERNASERFAKGMISDAATPHFEEASGPATSGPSPDPAPDLL
jgi:hypothetical protein